MKFKNEKELVEYCEENGLVIECEFIKNEEYEETEIINSENKQKLVYALIFAEDHYYEKGKKNLTVTSQYHDWNGTIADKMLKAIQDKDIEEWNNNVKEYNSEIEDYNIFGDMSKAEKNKFLDLDEIGI